MALALGCVTHSPKPLDLGLPLPQPCALGACRNVAIVLDLSRSTAVSWSSSPSDGGSLTIFDAEIGAAETYIGALEPAGVAALLVSVSYPPPDSVRQARGPKASAWTDLPLTSDMDGVIRALHLISERTPWGNTNLAAGVDQATIELLGLRDAAVRPAEVGRGGARCSMVIFTDGDPTLPYGPTATEKNVAALARALDRARRGQIRTYLIVLGPHAHALSSLAGLLEETGGRLVEIAQQDRLDSSVRAIANEASL
jgi:hypothetical protein